MLILHVKYNHYNKLILLLLAEMKAGAASSKIVTSFNQMSYTSLM